MRSLSEVCHLNKIFNNTSIRNRIWFGFGIMLAILLFVSLSTLSKFVNLNNGISHVTEKVQPVILSAQNLESRLEAASNMLGFYLLTTEEGYRKNYFSQLDNAIEEANQLALLHLVSTNSEYSNIVAIVQKDIEALSSYRNTMVKLVNDVSANVPAQLMAAEKLNPKTQELQALVNQMIGSDYEEDNSDSSRDTFRQALYDLRYYSIQITSELRSFFAFRSKSNVDNMNSFIEIMLRKLDYLEKNEDMYTFEQGENMLLFIETYKQYFQDLKETIGIHSTDKYRTDIFLVKTEIGPLVSDIESNIGSLVEKLKVLITHTSNDLQDEASTAKNKVTIGMSIGLFIGVIVAFLISRMITLPINHAVNAMNDLAHGEGDLTQRLDDNGKSEIALMASGFNKFAIKVQALVSQLATSVENLSTVVRDVTAIVEQTQVGSQQQRQQTELVATAVTEMTATIQEVASNANLAADSAQQADENAKLGQSVVRETVSSINSLASEIETGVNVINKLSQDTESIGSVLDVIKGIAEQTNLLALNAAIEAARAGDQGRGFAVVADEVRTLASRTQESTTEIESMIEALQVQAHSAVDAISQGQEKANTSVSNASNAGKALDEITNSVGIITSMNIQIATASEEQSAVSEEINQNVVVISHVADDNAAASDKLASSSHELEQLAHELQKLVSQFKY